MAVPKTVQELIRKVQRYGFEYTFNRYLGTYPAIVTDNSDPENRHRIKCKCTDVWGNEPSENWVLPKGLPLGDSMGISMLPAVGDTVMVSFIWGSPARPMWQFCMQPKGRELPTPKDDAIQIVTKNGLRLIMDNSNNSVTIEDGQGAVMVIERTGKFRYENTLGSKIEVDGAQVAVNGAARTLSDTINGLHNFDAQHLTVSPLGLLPVAPDAIITSTLNKTQDSIYIKGS